jgi:hypothetical protein
MISGDQCAMLEERHEAARFLRRMQAVAPRMAGHFDHAAALYDEVAALGTALWPWPIAPNAGALQALADRRTRRDLAGYIRAASDTEAQAVSCLEQALASLKGSSTYCSA